MAPEIMIPTVDFHLELISGLSIALELMGTSGNMLLSQAFAISWTSANFAN